MWKVWMDKARDDFWFLMSWIMTEDDSLSDAPPDVPLDDWDYEDLDDAPTCYDNDWQDDDCHDHNWNDDTFGDTHHDIF